MPSDSARASPARRAGASCVWTECCISGSDTPTTEDATAQLAWRRDHSKTWTFADWKFAEFGIMGFVNYGRNYAVRDDYVYAYSHDDPHADTPADRFVLMLA